MLLLISFVNGNLLSFILVKISLLYQKKWRNLLVLSKNSTVYLIW